VNLQAADRSRVRELLEEAWRRRAPKRLVQELEAGGGGAVAGRRSRRDV
jgi:hypothetical protein